MISFSKDISSPDCVVIFFPFRSAFVTVVSGKKSIPTHRGLLFSVAQKLCH